MSSEIAPSGEVLDSDYYDPYGQLDCTWTERDAHGDSLGDQDSTCPRALTFLGKSDLSQSSRGMVIDLNALMPALSLVRLWFEGAPEVHRDRLLNSSVCVICGPPCLCASLTLFRLERPTMGHMVGYHWRWRRWTVQRWPKARSRNLDPQEHQLSRLRTLHHKDISLATSN
jgi:hypothetical protein